MAGSIDITDQHLINLAGPSAFERGREYFQAGRVGSWTKSGNAVTAEVAGSRSYFVRLTLDQSGCSGRCTCPASDGANFCKHCVAVALAYREQAEQSSGPALSPTAERIRAFVQSLKPEQLANELLQIVNNDSGLTAEWAIKADVALGKVDDKAIKKRITAALPYNRHLFQYSQVRAYFAKAQPVVDQLAQQIHALPAQKALNLVDYALQRLARALLTVDDSGGFRAGIEATLHELHVQTTARLDLPADKMASYLFELYFGDLADMYPSIPSAYAGAVSEKVLQSFYQLVQAQWDQLPPLRSGSDWDQQYHYLRLQEPLLERARAHGDFDGEVKLLAKTATDERNYLDLCTLCMDHQQWDQAELWLARAKKAAGSDNHRHTSLGADRLQVRLHLQRGESAAAVELQWKIFAHSVALKDYLYLLELNEGGAKDADYAVEARRYLISRLDDEQNQRYTLPFTSALLAIYLHEDDLSPAVQLCHEREIDTAQILQLARQLGGQPIATIPLYRKAVAKEVARGNNQAYRQAVTLLQEVAASLQVPAHDVAFAELLGQLRTQFKAKRNFIKMLDESFGEG